MLEEAELIQIALELDETFLGPEKIRQDQSDALTSTTEWAQLLHDAQPYRGITQLNLSSSSQTAA